MVTDTPEDWAFERACSWVGRKPHHVRSMTVDNPERRAISALCDMIAKHEQKPIDRKLLCARQAAIQEMPHHKARIDEGVFDDSEEVAIPVRAIELWIEGYGE